MDLNRAGGRVYEVGGTVRDRLLKRPHKDKDLLVTGLPLPDIQRLLRKHGEVFTVGKSFGVLKFRHREDPEVQFDVTLPRYEVSTGLGHREFDVDYDRALPVEVDLSRRDFTINAMAIESAAGKLIDPFGGEEDLKNHVLRMVFDRAFEEDPL